MQTARAGLPADDRETKLPVWARDLIAALRHQVEAETERRVVAELARPVSECDAVTTADYQHWVGIGRGIHGQVRFLLDGPGRTDGDRLDAYVRNGRLSVRGDSGLVVVHPSSGNSFEVSVVDR
jgi:hypothetical protein